MNNILILLLAAALLAGCAGKPRAGGPAPVESVRDRSAPNAVAPAPVEPVVDVYAYRGPNKAPAAAPPSANPPKESGGSSGTMLALRSETPDPGRASRANVTPTDYHGVTRQAMPLRSKLDDPRMANNSARERHPQEIGSLRKRG